MSHSRANRLACLAVLVAGWLLVACAEEDAGPQFATDPRPTRAPTEAAASPSPAPALLPTTEAVATPASFTDLLTVRGAASVVYVVSGNIVWSVSSEGDATQRFESPSGFAIVAIDPSPDGQEVAILLGASSSGRQTSQVVIVDADGSLVDRVDAPVGSAATPVASRAGTEQTIDWSPQGDKVVAQFATGEVIEILTDAREAPITLNFAEAAGAVIAPAWSPTGQSIAFISESEDGETRSLRKLDITTGEISTLVTPLGGRLVVDFAWLPDGISLLFTEGGAPGSAITGIDLWRVDASGENRALVASAGTVAPVARIANLSPSPDGRSVAYAVLVPGPSGPAVDSVWVRSLGSGIGFRIALPSVASVDDIWWTDEGLVVSVVTRPTARGRPPTQALLLAKRDGSISALWAAPAAVAAPARSTPVAGTASP
jgi:dipeptidyl aminopeptidase/acylaminoacyl peptidase